MRLYRSISENSPGNIKIAVDKAVRKFLCITCNVNCRSTLFRSEDSPEASSMSVRTATGLCSLPETYRFVQLSKSSRKSDLLSHRISSTVCHACIYCFCSNFQQIALEWGPECCNIFGQRFFAPLKRTRLRSNRGIAP